MEKELLDEIKKGTSLKRPQSLQDKSSPVLVAEIENTISEDLKEEIKKGVQLKKAKSFDRSSPSICLHIEQRIDQRC